MRACAHDRTRRVRSSAQRASTLAQVPAKGVPSRARAPALNRRDELRPPLAAQGPPRTLRVVLGTTTVAGKGQWHQPRREVVNPWDGVPPPHVYRSGSPLILPTSQRVGTTIHARCGGAG